MNSVTSTNFNESETQHQEHSTPSAKAVLRNLSRQFRELREKSGGHLDDLSLVAFPAMMLIGSHFETVNRAFVAGAMGLYGSYNWSRAKSESLQGFSREKVRLRAVGGLLGITTAAWLAYRIIAGMPSFERAIVDAISKRCSSQMNIR